MSSRIAIALTLSAFLTLSCGKNDLPEYNNIGTLRVLGIRATPPEAAIGDTVTVTPLISDINGSGRTVTVTAEACNDPGVAYGADPNCSGSVTRVALNPGAANLSSPGFTAFTSTTSVTIPSSAFTGYSTIEQYNGVNYLIVFTLTTASGETVKAFKRILVSTRPTKNSNPTFTDLTIDGQSLSSLPNRPVAIATSIPTSSTETYSSLTSTGAISNQTETLTTTWFASDGAFERTRIENLTTNNYTPPGVRPNTHGVVLVVVVRDGHGGEEAVIKTL